MKLMLNGKEVSGMGHYVMAGDIKDATAEDSNVLSGKAYYNNNGKREGTMPNRGGMSAELAAGGSTTIPEGYHNGEGVVRAQDLASQTQGTAGAGDIASGKTAYVNGAKVTGTGELSRWEVVKEFAPAASYTQTMTLSANATEDTYLEIVDVLGRSTILPLKTISWSNTAVTVNFPGPSNTYHKYTVAVVYNKPNQFKISGDGVSKDVADFIQTIKELKKV